MPENQAVGSELLILRILVIWWKVYVNLFKDIVKSVNTDRHNIW